MALSFESGVTVSVPEIRVAPGLRLPAAASAVLVVDMQNDFLKPGGTLVVPDGMPTVPAIQGLLASARAAGAHVAYTQDTHLEGDLEWTIWPRHTERGTWGWQVIDELAPHGGDLVVEKARYDGFYGTSLDHYLTRQWAVKHLVIVGTISSICVLHTAASAGLRWFHVVVPADCTSALNDFDQALTLRQVSWLYAGEVVRGAGDIAFE